MSSRGKRKGDRFYAVSTGRQIGIYTSYGKAAEQTIGFKGGIVRKYNTQREALQDMRLNGHSDPPIFKHQDIDIPSCSSSNAEVTNQNTSASDTDLRLDVFYDGNANLSSSNQEKSPLFVLDHSISTEDDSYTLPQRAQSDTEITLSLHNQIFSKPAAQCQDENTKVKEAFISENDAEYTNSHDGELSDLNLPDALFSFMKQTRDMLTSLSDHVSSLHNDIKTQQEQIDQLHKTQKKNNKFITNEIMYFKEETVNNATLSNKVDKLLNDIKCFTEIHSKSSSLPEQVPVPLTKLIQQCSTITETNDDLKDSVNNCLKTQEKLQSDIDQIRSTTQKLIVQNDNQNEVMHYQNTCQQQLLGKVEENLALNQQLFLRIETLNEDHQNTNISNSNSIPSKCSASPHGNVSSHDDNFSSNVTHAAQSTPVRDKDSFEDTEILKSHAYNTEILKNNVSSSKPLNFWVPDSCKGLLIGDSNNRLVAKKRLDSTGETEIRTFHGATIDKISSSLSATNTSFRNVSRVTFVIGSNDCNRNFLDIGKIIYDAENLLKLAAQVFPNAKISIVEIPPQEKGKINSVISSINDKLKHRLKKSDFSFIPCSYLWSHVDSDGIPVRGLVTSGTRLSPAAVHDLLKPIKDFLLHNKRSKHMLADKSITFENDRVYVHTPSSHLMFDSKPLLPENVSNPPNSEGQSNHKPATVQLKGSDLATTTKLDLPTQVLNSQLDNHILPTTNTHGTPYSHSFFSQMPFRHLPTNSGIPLYPGLSPFHPVQQFPFLSRQFAMNSLYNPYSMGDQPFSYGLGPRTFAPSSSPPTNFALRGESMKNNAQANSGYHQNTNL